jgi:hypothetical protein
MKDSSVFKKMLIGALLATSLMATGCGPTEEKTQNPEAVPNIPPSDRSSPLPGTDTKNTSGGKPTKPAN